jgi:hypothetical protein
VSGVVVIVVLIVLYEVCCGYCIVFEACKSDVFVRVDCYPD